VCDEKPADFPGTSPAGRPSAAFRNAVAEGATVAAAHCTALLVAGANHNVTWSRRAAEEGEMEEFKMEMGVLLTCSLVTRPFPFLSHFDVGRSMFSSRGE